MPSDNNPSAVESSQSQVLTSVHARSVVALPSIMPHGLTQSWLLSLTPVMTLGRHLSALDPPAPQPLMTFRTNTMTTQYKVCIMIYLRF